LLEILLCGFEFGRVFFDPLFKRLSEIALSLGYCLVGIFYDCGNDGSPLRLEAKVPLCD
jgi:hypothetical protein